MGTKQDRMKKIAVLCGMLTLCIAARAQEEMTPQEALEQRTALLESTVQALQRLKVSGYVQVQNQWGGPDASLKVGTPNADPTESFTRLGIRRGRIKFTYETGLASAVFQLDATEKGVGVKDAYLNIKDPWFGTMGIKAGVFDRPFGYEISYSSSLRESPERSTVFQTLFPDERDLGAMLTLQPSKTSPWSILKLEAGLFAGNGIKQENDNQRDFIGHLSVTKDWNRAGFGAGVSYYNGQALVAAENTYFQREYLGFDARFTLDSGLGLTKLHAEYLTGEQPGMGDFNGGYVMLVHYLGRTPMALVGKYDWFAPETTRRETIGFGMFINLNPGIRLTGYYELTENKGDDLDDNVFTLRLQYKF